MAAAYLRLVDRLHAHSGLAVIPNDLDQIHALLMASDASNKTIGYNIGVALKPKKTKGKSKSEDNLEESTMKLVSYHSRGLNTHILN